MSLIDSWVSLNVLKSDIVEKIDKILIFGVNGSEIIFSTKECVYGFGSNSFGGLGFGHKNVVKESQKIVELSDKQIVDFTYGSNFVLAKTKFGKLYSWGENSYGQLGIGTNTSDYRPNLIDSLSDRSVIEMSCGRYHTLVLTDDNQLYGFGFNRYGSIGCENTFNQWKPIKVNGFTNEKVISISCGGWHSLALTQTGNVYSWGQNGFGQLGFGNKADTNSPRKIIFSNRLVFKQIICGSKHSLLLSNCGDVYVFGSNINGSLGTGNTSDSSIPIKVNDLKFVKEIASHFDSDISMAKLKDSTRFVWGQCLNGNKLKPEETQHKSFNNIIAYHSVKKITVKAIKLSNYHKEEDLLIKCSERIFSSNNNCIPFEKVVELIKHSIDNNMNELKAKCIDRIKDMTTIDNICNVYEVSAKYGLNELENNCIEFVKSLNSNEKQNILSTDSYNKLTDNIRVKILEILLKRECNETSVARSKLAIPVQLRGRMCDRVKFREN